MMCLYGIEDRQTGHKENIMTSTTDSPAINTVNLHIDDGGAGNPPVLFLHSLAGNATQWDAQLAHLRTSRRAVALDLRGHGRSPSGAAGDYGIAALVEDVHVAVQRLGLPPMVLVGHSMGGAVAAAYAGANPEQVAGLLLADPSGDSTQMPREQVAQIMGAMDSEAYAPFMDGYWAQILDGATDETVARVMADLHATPRETVVEISKSLFEFNPTVALRRYSGPKLTVITHLNEGPMALQALDPGLDVVAMRGVGHWLQMDKPDAFNEILDEFMVRLR